MADDRSLYRRLGVSPTSTTPEIHDAYRALAGRFHPDRRASASPADRAVAERRMREINEAWHVLRDPQRRRDYDRSRTTAATARSTATVRTAPRPADPDLRIERASATRHSTQLGVIRGLPWIALVVLLLGIVVATAYADRESDEPVTAPRPDVGDCIDLRAGLTVTIVDCDGPHQYRIEARVPGPDGCPPGTEARRLGNDSRFDCLSPG